MIVWSLNNYLGLANHPEVRKADADAAKAEPKIGFCERQLNDFKGFCSDMVNPVKWGEGIVGMVKRVPWAVTGMVMASTLHKAMEKINHSDTIFWFKDTYTTYPTIMLYTISYITNLEKEYDTPEASNHAKRLAMHAVQDLVQQIEKIVGYMHYRGPHFGEHTDIARDIAHRLVNKTDAFVALFNQELTQATIDAQKLKTDAKELYEFIDTAIDDFGRLDTDIFVTEETRVARHLKNCTRLGREMVQLPADLHEKVLELLLESRSRKAQETELQQEVKRSGTCA